MWLCWQDAEDLPFKKGEVLEVISKDEDKWWCAKNSAGRTGQIPVPYVAPVSHVVNCMYIYFFINKEVKQVIMGKLLQFDYYL